MRTILFLAVVCLVLAALLETANSKPADKKAKKGKVSTPAKGKASLKAAIHTISKAAKGNKKANAKSPAKKDAKAKKEQKSKSKNAATKEKTANKAKSVSNPATKPKAAKSTPAKPKAIKTAEPKLKSLMPEPSSAPIVAERDANNFDMDNFNSIGAEHTEFDRDNDLSEEGELLDDDASAGGSSGDYSGIELDQDSQYPD
uniref:1106 effector family protein variant n=1 Tax=Globodera rostochiensis TaxID=31243 RepID=A0A914I7E8_GLORO